MERERWYPVAAVADLAPHHIYQTRLGEAPLAIWCAADGTINIWDDRCPHRGVRLSIGHIVGKELRCQYHAWRFASGSGVCTHIPARPDAKPAAAIRTRIWPVAVSDGMVWTAISPVGEPSRLGDGSPFRAVPFNRNAGEVAKALPPMAGVFFVLQPTGHERSVVRGVCALARFTEIDAILEALRFDLEAVC